jgi:hypothetical protein
MRKKSKRKRSKRRIRKRDEMHNHDGMTAPSVVPDFSSSCTLGHHTVH